MIGTTYGNISPLSPPRPVVTGTGYGNRSDLVTPPPAVRGTLYGNGPVGNECAR